MSDTSVKTLQRLLSPEPGSESILKELIADYERMASSRAPWESEVNEVLAYLSATDTRTTTNNKLPFHNSTTIPKLSQIRQNIVTAYMEHTMAHSRWVQWDAANENEDTRAKRDVIEAYVRTKVRSSGGEAEVERLVDDFTAAGIAIVKTRHVKEMIPQNNAPAMVKYIGAKMERINPFDFYYDITAPTLDKARKCIRSLYTLGGLKKMVGEDSDSLITEQQFDEIRRMRLEYQASIKDDPYGSRKRQSLIRAGFGDMLNYIEQGTVEVLHFYGDFYDMEADELLENHEIVVVDRRIIAKKQPIPTLAGSQHLHISVWEYRENTLAPIGPLARIVGLQYKVDKLENLRADIFDRIADPAVVEVGDVRFHGVRGAPGARYEVDEGGDVRYLQVPVQALNADLQINQTLALMEELSGAPREAIGQRTPGEKTKFEVQLLDQGQSKLFRRKVKKFEEELLSPVLHDYLELGRLYLDTHDVVATFDDELGIETFVSITQSDLAGLGHVRARGSSVFAERANALQNLVQLSGTPLFQMTNHHWSRMRIARTLEELADLSRYQLVTENIGLQEDAATQRFAQTLQDGNMQSGMMDGDFTDDGEEMM